jgi:hypothetical protein
MHPAVPGLIVKLGLTPIFTHVTGLLGLLVTLTSIVIAYAFYLAFEAPSHRLAIAVSNRVKSIQPSATFAVADS